MKNKAKNKPSGTYKTKTIDLPQKTKEISDKAEKACLEEIIKVCNKYKCKLGLNAQVTINGQPVQAVIAYIG